MRWLNNKVAVILFWILFPAVPSIAQLAPSKCTDGQCIQVGTYNIELLGSTRKPYGGVDRGPRSDEELDRISRRIADEIDLEVIVFQEINKDSDEWKTLKDKLSSKGYDFIEGNSSDRKQYVIIAWDKDEVSLLDGSGEELDVRSAFDLENGCTENGLRKPVAGHFRVGKFDFWLIGVHLKSRSGEAGCTAAIRNEQCKDLVAKVREIQSRSGEDDFLIVGDCNEELGHKSFSALRDAGFISQMNFLMAGSGNGSYIKVADLNESGDLIDHVWLRYGQTQEVVRQSACVMRLDSGPETKKYIIEQSDHVPAWVSFRIDEDLDED